MGEIKEIEKFNGQLKAKLQNPRPRTKMKMTLKFKVEIEVWRSKIA